MKDSIAVANEVQAIVVKYCERCARRSLKLSFDDLSLKELCPDCLDRLTHRRGFITRPAEPRR